MNGGKNENSIDSTSLWTALRMRDDTGLRTLRRATEFTEDTNNRVCHLVFSEICTKRGNIRNTDGIREKIRRICDDLRSPVPSQKGEWKKKVGGKISDHELEQQTVHDSKASGLWAREKSESEGRGGRFNADGIYGSRREVKERKNQSKG